MEFVSVLTAPSFSATRKTTASACSCPRSDRTNGNRSVSRVRIGIAVVSLPHPSSNCDAWHRPRPGRCDILAHCRMIFELGRRPCRQVAQAAAEVEMLPKLNPGDGDE